MSISTEISRIKAAKESLKRAINAKGGSLSNELIDDYAAAVTALPSGGSDINLSFITATASDILTGKVGADKDGNPVTGTLVIPSVPEAPDLSVVTVTPDTMLKGKVAVNSAGQQITGTIETVTASLKDNVVTVPAGYIAEPQTLTVAEATAPSVSGNVVTVNKGYLATEKKITVGTAKAAEAITPGTADKTIAAGTYLSGALTVKGDSTLVPENIAEGVSIFNVQGTHKGGINTSTAVPAAAKDTRLGKEFFANGSKFTGTMPDSEIQFANIAGAHKTVKRLEISSGYLAEDFSLDYNEAYPELTATAADIRKGKTAIAVIGDESGNFLYGEVTGTLEEASGGGGEFYKCAAVYGPYDVETVVISGCPVSDANGEYLPTDQTTSDWEGKQYSVYANGKGWYYGYSEFGGWGITQDINNGLNYQGQVGGGEWYDWNEGMPVSGMTGVNGTATLDADVPKTWDGHKAVLTNGVYVFEDALTTGLTYSDTKPEKYGIYNDGAMMKLDWIIQDYPTIGLSFFASLTDDLTLAESGQTLTVSGAQKATVDDVSCAKFFGADNYSKVECQTSLNIIDGHNYTVAFGFRVDSDQDGGWLMGIGSWDDTVYKVMFQTYESDGKWYGFVKNGNSDDATACSFEIERDKWNYVVVTKNPKTRNVTVWLNGAVVGTFSTDFIMANGGVRLGYNGNDFGKGYLNNVMVYNRALTEAEIGQLVDKFSPTA